jgi:hypothetical protein
MNASNIPLSQNIRTIDLFGVFSIKNVTDMNQEMPPNSPVKQDYFVGHISPRRTTPTHVAVVTVLRYNHSPTFRCFKYVRAALARSFMLQIYKFAVQK